MYGGGYDTYVRGNNLGGQVYLQSELNNVKKEMNAKIQDKYGLKFEYGYYVCTNVYDLVVKNN